MMVALLATLVAAIGYAAFGLRGDPDLPVTPTVAADGTPTTGVDTVGEPPPGVAPAGQDPDVGLRVMVTVTSEEQFLHPVTAPVVAQRPGARQSLPTTLLAGVGAQLRGDDGRGFSLVAITTEDGARLVRRAAFDPAQAQAHLVGLPAPVTGTVVTADGKPIAGARLWLGEHDAAGLPVEVVSDTEGHFAATTATGDGVPIVVHATGFAAVAEFVEMTLAGLERKIVLVPSTPLRVQLVGIGQPGTQARVFVVPLATVSSELSSYPFFAQTIAGGWPVDGNGLAVIDDLPRDCEVGVVVVHPLAPITAPRAVRLRDRAENLALPMSYVAPRSGRVVDARGVPVAGARVFGCDDPQRLPTGPARRLLPAQVEAPGLLAAFGDREGAFVIGDAAAWWRVEAPGHAGRVIVPTDPADPVVLPRWVGGPVEFVLVPPRAGSVWIGATNLGGGLQQPLVADIPWRVSLPHAGRFTFDLQTFVDGVAKGHERREHVDATGPIELRAPSPE